MKYQKLIDRIIGIAEDNGWSVTVEYCGNSKSLYFEFAQYTDRGQDFSFSAEMKEGDVRSLIENINSYYESYDPDEEAILWTGPDGHGRNGAPYRLSEIIKDMEDVETMVKELLDAIIDADLENEDWEEEE